MSSAARKNAERLARRDAENAAWEAEKEERNRQTHQLRHDRSTRLSEAGFTEEQVYTLLQIIEEMINE